MKVTTRHIAVTALLLSGAYHLRAQAQPAEPPVLLRSESDAGAFVQGSAARAELVTQKVRVRRVNGQVHLVHADGSTEPLTPQEFDHLLKFAESRRAGSSLRIAALRDLESVVAWAGDPAHVGQTLRLRLDPDMRDASGNETQIVEKPDAQQVVLYANWRESPQTFAVTEFQRQLSNRFARQALSQCKSNLKTMGTAMEMYSTDYGGRYPTTLEPLLSNPALYLKELPTCPVTGKMTYTVRSTAVPDAYTLTCGGDNHHAAGLGPDSPAYTSNEGLIRCDPVH